MNTVDANDAKRATHRLKHVYTSLKNTENTFDAFRLHFADEARLDFVRTHPFFSESLERLKAQAADDDTIEIPALTYSQYKMLDTTGSRREFSRPYFKRRRMLNTYAALALLYPGEESYLRRLEDMIWVICGEYAWCETAHMDGESLQIIEHGDWRVENGVITPVLRDHARRVDLFNAETAFALAEITALLRGRLAPLVVNRAVNEVMRRTLLPFMQFNRYFFWETTDNNWGAVCAACVGAAAMYLIADSAMLAPLLTRCVQTMDCFIDGFTEDGVCPEGLGYWDYGFGFFICFAEMLKRRTGDAVDLFDNEKVRRIAAFQQRAYLSGDQVVSFCDAALRHPFNAGVVHYLRTLFGIETPDPAFMNKHIVGTHPHFPYVVRMLAWANPDYGETIADTYTCLYPDAQWFVCKRRVAGKTFVLAAKGGHNGEPHNHNDLGTFIVHFDGVSLLPDIGSGEYTRQYFAEESRYTYFCNSSLGHSVPIINGLCQQTGGDYRATVEGFDETGYFSVDISRAYGLPALSALRRAFSVEAGGDSRALLRLTLTDTYTFVSPPESLTERFVSFIAPELTAAQTVRIGTAHARADITYPADRMTLTISQTPFVRHEGQTVPVYVLDFAVSNPQRAEAFTFVFDIGV